MVTELNEFDGNVYTLVGTWAVPMLKSNPQTHEILNNSFQKSVVHLIIGVSNTKKWQGFAIMESTIPEISAKFSPIAPGFSPLFRIWWIKRYTNIESGEGLSFARTQPIVNKLNGVTINSCRNGQELDQTCGKLVCDMVTEEVDDAERDREAKLKAKTPVNHFFVTTENKNQEEVWQKFLKEVAKVAKILFACHIGSRSYNLHEPSSDADMVVIFACPTEELLHFEVPKKTIKNESGFEPDFTLHEVGYYLQLLISGDARMIETLFQHEHSVVYRDKEWNYLESVRQMFLTQDMVRKYVSEVHGNKGFKKLESLTQNMKTQEDKKRVFKQYYILLRLLHHAKQVASGLPLSVWLDDNSEARKTLMNVRHGEYTFEELMQLCKDEVKKIQDLLQISKIPATVREEDIKQLEEWLVGLRMNNWNDGSPWTLYTKEMMIEEFIIPSTQYNDVLEKLPSASQVLYMVATSSTGVSGVYIAPIKEAIVGKFLESLSSGNPNSIWLLFLPSLVEIPWWSRLKEQKALFLNQKALMQSMGYVQNQLNLERKNPGKFQYSTVVPALFLLKEFLEVTKVNLSEKISREATVPLEIDNIQGLEYCKDIMQLAKETFSGQNASTLEMFPKNVSTEGRTSLKQWMITLTKMYLVKNEE